MISAFSIFSIVGLETLAVTLMSRKFSIIEALLGKVMFKWMVTRADVWGGTVTS